MCLSSLCTFRGRGLSVPTAEGRALCGDLSSLCRSKSPRRASLLQSYGPTGHGGWDPATAQSSAPVPGSWRWRPGWGACQGGQLPGGASSLQQFSPAQATAQAVSLMGGWRGPQGRPGQRAALPQQPPAWSRERPSQGRRFQRDRGSRESSCSQGTSPCLIGSKCPAGKNTRGQQSARPMGGQPAAFQKPEGLQGASTHSWHNPRLPVVPTSVQVVSGLHHTFGRWASSGI